MPKRWLKRVLLALSLGGVSGCVLVPLDGKTDQNRLSVSPVPSDFPTVVPLYAAPVWRGAKWDQNQDGALSYEEYVEGRLSEIRFIKAPTEQELANLRASFLEEARRLDKDGDGRITPDEYDENSQE